MEEKCNFEDLIQDYISAKLKIWNRIFYKQWATEMGLVYMYIKIIYFHNFIVKSTYYFYYSVFSCDYG